MLEFVECESWDATPAGQIDRIGRSLLQSNYRWGGSAPSSVIAGFDGSGQALRGVSGYLYTTITSLHRTFIFRCRLRVRTTAVSQSLVRVGQTAGSVGIELRTNASSQWILTEANGAPGTFATFTYGPVLNTIYDVEIGVTPGLTANAGHVRMTFDGIEVYNQTGLALGGGATAFVSNITFLSGNLDIDDCVIQAGAAVGFTNADFLSTQNGNPKIYTLYPTAQGTYAQFSRFAGGPDNFNEIDEVVCDSDTTYLYHVAQGDRDSWTMTAVDASVTQIYGLFFSLAVNGGGLAAPNVHFIRIGTGDFDDPDAADGAFQYHHRKRPYLVSPDGSGAWTKAKIDAAEFGSLANVGTGTGFKLSQAYIQVLASTTPPPDPTFGSLNTGLLQRVVHRLAKCWRIIRRDGVEFRFTAHDSGLILEDGLTYEPAGGLSGTSIKKEIGLREQNADFLGAVTSDKITQADLRAGRFRGAEVIEYIVDWLYPWAGSVHTSQYVVLETRFDDKKWTASVGGLTHRLERKNGLVFNRTCRHKLYGPGCNVSPASFTFAGEEVGASTDRRLITAAGLVLSGTESDGYFNDGELTFTSGLNIGIMGEVQLYTQSGLSIELYLPMPFDIAAGDTFTIVAGCDKRRLGNCKTKFNNVINFGGFSFIPGRDRSIKGGRT